jgi:purine-nucleoside phosphorylase
LQYVVQGHAGKLVFGILGESKTPVVLLVGRAQSVSILLNDLAVDILIKCYSFYEGHDMPLVTFATRVCKLLGIEIMIGQFEKLPKRTRKLLLTEP